MAFPTALSSVPMPHICYALPALHRIPSKDHLKRRRLQPFRPVQGSRISASAAGLVGVPPQYRHLDWDSPGELPPSPEKTTILTLMPYLMKLAFSDKRVYWRIGIATAFLVVSKITGLMAPVLLKDAVEAVTASEIGVAVQALWVAGLYRLISGIAKEAQNPIFTPVAQVAARKIASNTFAHVLDLDINFHLNKQSGSLSKALDRGVRSIQMIFRIIVFTFIPTLVELVLVCGILGRSFGPQLALIVAASFAAYIWWTLHMSEAASAARKEANTHDSLTAAKAIDVLQNFETVTLFDNKVMEVSQYDGHLKNYQDASVENERILATANAGQHAILTCGLTFALVLTTMCATGQPVTSGSLVLVQGFLLQLWLPLQFLGWFYREVRQCLVDVDEYFSILKTKSNLPDGHLLLPENKSEIKMVTSSNGGHTKTGKGASNHIGQVENISGIEVKLQNVNFGYSEDRPILKGPSIHFKPGQSTAIVGSSGSGKSTILKIIARLYDVTGGSVKFDGLDVRDIKQSSLRSIIGVVPQDTVLFNDTIMENIRYGKPTATDEEVFKAAELAQLHATISLMPEKYNTIVGERGLKLSGGEKQRVAIARTFLRAPRLLICDEATSALDTATEQEIMVSLTQLAKGRTSVFVAHRLSTLKNCDQIIVMSDGQVIQQGSHDELISMNGAYHNMWYAQVEAKKINGQGNGALELQAA